MSQLTGSAGRGLYRHIFRRSEQLANVGPEGLTAGGVYIAGKMSGLPKANYPAFMRAERFLEKHGVASINPARLEQTLPNQYGKQWAKLPKHAGSPKQEMARFEADFPGDIRSKWEAFMKADRELAKQSNLTILMEKGIFGSLGSWRTSAGAKSELALTKKIGSRAVSLESPKDPGRLVDLIHRARVKQGIRSPIASESSYGGREVMKPHPDYGFPGGRAQLFAKGIEKTILEGKHLVHRTTAEKLSGILETGLMSGHDALISLGRVEAEVGATLGARGSLNIKGMKGRIDDMTTWFREVGPGGKFSGQLGSMPPPELGTGAILDAFKGKRLKGVGGYLAESPGPELRAYEQSLPVGSKQAIERGLNYNLMFGKKFGDVLDHPSNREMVNEAFTRAWGKEISAAGDIVAKTHGADIGEQYTSYLLGRQGGGKVTRHISATLGGVGLKSYGDVAIVPRIGKSLNVQHAGEAFVPTSLITARGTRRTVIAPDEALYFVEEKALRGLSKNIRNHPLVRPMSELESMTKGIESTRSNPSAIRGIGPKTRVTSPVKKHSGFGSPWNAARAAFVDVEALGLGSIISKAGVEPGSAAYKKIIDRYGFEIAHQGLTSPPGIWEIGLSLPGDKGHPESIFMKPDKITKMEVGAEKAAHKAGTWDQFQTIINAADTPSEKAGIERALKQLKKSKATQILGWNIDNYDFPLIAERAAELGVDSDLIKNFKKLQVVDVKETAESILEGIFSKYKDKTGASIFGEIFDPASRSGVVDKLGWQKGFMKQENISILFGFKHHAHIAGGQYGDVAVLKQITGVLDDLGGANGPKAATDALRTVNKNIVGYYGKIIEQLTDEGRLIGDARTTAEQQLVHLKEATKGISNAKGTGILDLAESRGSPTEMHTSAKEAYERILPDELPDGAKIMQAHEERMVLARGAKEAKAPGGDTVIDIGKKIGRKFNDGLGKGVVQVIEGLADNIPKAFEFVERNRAGVAIAAAVGTAAYLLGSRDREKEFRGDYEAGLTSNIEAGMLGLSESEMKQAIMKAKSIRGLNSYLINRNKRVGKLNRLKEGEMIHREIQEALREDVQFIDAEVPVVDHELGIKGLADLVLEIGGEKTPVEIKTVEDQETLSRLTGPRMSHMSQANFYSHVLGSKGAYIVYATREEKQARKIFYQPYSGGMLAADIHRFRSSLVGAVKQQPSLSIQWAQQMKAMNYEPGIPEGIRPEGPGGYKGFDMMSAFDNFGWPGAREQTHERPKSAILSSRGRSRIRDQGARNHFTGPGHPKTPMDGNDTVNASRYGSPIG